MSLGVVLESGEKSCFGVPCRPMAELLGMHRGDLGNPTIWSGCPDRSNVGDLSTSHIGWIRWISADLASLVECLW